jgi:predicted RNA-binding Zn-ribbon protein involved in translation (DUF1610 family)
MNPTDGPHWRAYAKQTLAEIARAFPGVSDSNASETGASGALPPAGAPDTRPPAAPAKRLKRTPTFTTTPDTPAPQLHCPSCDRALAYRQTVISGVKPIERWDYFDCRKCGAFVYRDRTRKLRPTK